MTLYFKTSKENCEESDMLFLKLKTAFKKFIEPIYGDQKKFLEKIRLGKDRKCKLLIYNGDIEGILVYKTKNTFEFEGFGAPNALEIKTLMLIQKNRKLSGLMAVALYKQAALAATENKASCIVATVSSELKDAYNVAKKLGFIKINSLKNKNINETEEFLICHPNPSHLFNTTDKFELQYQKRADRGKNLAAV